MGKVLTCLGNTSSPNSFPLIWSLTDVFLWTIISSMKYYKHLLWHINPCHKTHHVILSSHSFSHKEWSWALRGVLMTTRFRTSGYNTSLLSVYWVVWWWWVCSILEQDSSTLGSFLHVATPGWGKLRFKSKMRLARIRHYFLVGAMSSGLDRALG